MNQKIKGGFWTLVIIFTLTFSLLILQAWASELTPDKSNVLYYKNFENVFDKDGNYKEPGSQILEGDHFVGIINLQEIVVEGASTWFQGIDDQITGIFALEVKAIFNSDPYGVQSLPHLVLGVPTQNSFCKGADCFSTDGILGTGEIIAFFHDASGTPFEFNGAMKDDVEKATDGELWLTLGYSSDNGYFYSHTSFTGTIANFTGESWGGLNAIRNNTGYAFAGINDPNEFEMGGPTGVIPGLLTNVHLSNELEGNPASVLLPGGYSPWDIRSNDPAYILPIEKEIECRMTGGGVTEDGEILLPELDNKGIPIEGTVAEADDEMIEALNSTEEDLDRYQFGGQVGAPTASQPQPYGEWTHHQQKGPDGMFTFHAGTASAPEGTEISFVECSDPGFCDPARPAPAKQIYFEGIGTFKNIKSEFLEGMVVTDKNKIKCTLHWFRVHVEDIGEPGPGGKQPGSPDCTHDIGTPVDPAAGDCENCADVYQISIHETNDPNSPVIYDVGGFIDNGNLQIHPAIK